MTRESTQGDCIHSSLIIQGVVFQPATITKFAALATGVSRRLWRIFFEAGVLRECAGAVGGGALIAFAPADYKFHKTRPASARVLLLLCRRKGYRPDWEMKLKQTRPCELELLIKEWPLSQRAGSGACSQPAVSAASGLSLTSSSIPNYPPTNFEVSLRIDWNFSCSTQIYHQRAGWLLFVLEIVGTSRRASR